MSLLDNLVKAYATTDLPKVCATVGIDTKLIKPINWLNLKEASLAQWLYNSDSGTSQLATTANNFANLLYRDEMNGFANKISTKLSPDEPADLEYCQFGDVDKFIIGYWKFLTRSPYQGLENHTNSSETFLGFITQQGFSSDPNYVKKIVELIPAARSLLLAAGGGTVPAPPDILSVVSTPKTVEVGVAFTVKGTGKVADRGKSLTVNVDDKFPLQGIVVGSDGKWQIESVFNQAGNRNINISNGVDRVVAKIQAVPSFTASGNFSIAGSVGSGGVNNPADVKTIVARLNSLGFDWAGDPSNGSIKTSTILAIKLFQSIVNGSETVNDVDGRIDVNGFTLSWLQASNAPRWITMPPSNEANGLYNYEQEQTDDDHDFGTDWLATAIIEIAKSYQTTYRNNHNGSAPIAINDASQPHGGDTPDHRGHETGMMFDLLLPKKGGQFGGITVNSSEYDRKATKAMLIAINNHPLFKVAYLNDDDLIDEGLCGFAGGHDNHIHFQISPPTRRQ
jgi:hypothetical protein